MKKSLNIILAAVNVLLILIYMYVSRKIFLGVYISYLFWGISLYVLTSSCILLTNNKKAKIMQGMNVLLTVVSIAWFIIYMPVYTPSEAIDVLKASNEFDYTYSFYINESDPVDIGAINSYFVKSAYNIIAEGKEKFNVKFNPVSGKFSVETDADSVSKSIISLPGDGYYTIDEEFMAKLENAGSSYHEIFIILKDYMEKWQSKLDYCYNTLYNLLGDEAKESLKEDQSKWESTNSEQLLFEESIYFSEFGEGHKLDILKFESRCRLVRERAIFLNNMLSKFKVDSAL